MKKRTQLFYAIFEIKNSFVIGVANNKVQVVRDNVSEKYNFKNSKEFLLNFGRNKKLKYINLSLI